VLKSQLITSLKDRLREEITDPRNSLKYLKTLKVEDYFDQVISIIYLYTRQKKGGRSNTVYLTEIICAIGHAIRNKYKLPRNSAVAARTGAFVLWTFEQHQILEVLLGAGSKGHAAYIIRVLDDDAISSLWDNLDPHQIEKLPSDKPYAPWTSTKHETGAFLVKTGNKEVLEIIKPETHPLVFKAINVSQQTGWQINEYIYNLHLWALRNKTEAFSDIWELHNPEARATKIREAKAIGGIARRFLGKVFYHLYYYDFRGRKYPATAYLHEQGSDLARGLLLRGDCRPIGREGFFWLMVTIANNWAGDSGSEYQGKTDKIPLKHRFEWAADNQEIFISYAENPKVNQGWMKADKPWQFLAACHELLQLRKWQYENGNDFDCYDYPSHLECYIDGSNNGSQHLSALTRDEVTAPHVNLVPLELPGDLYKYVSDHVWKRLEDRVKELTSEEIRECERCIDDLIQLKREINEAEPKSTLREELIQKIKKFKETNKDLIDIAAPVYWMRIRDVKQRRKVVKRNVMTLPYGGTPYGLGQLAEDKCL
jgi:hypothetical protein